MSKNTRFIVILSIILLFFMTNSCMKALTTITDDQGFIYEDFGSSAYTVYLDNLVGQSVITVPSTYNNKPVISVGNYVNHESPTNITTEIILPEGIEYISDKAFAGFTLLTTIELPKSITRIGSYAFHNCTSLTHLTLPEGITRIETNTFLGCINLEELTIPKSVIAIDKDAFKECYKLISLYFDEGSPFSLSEGVIYNLDHTILIYYLPSNLALSYEIIPGVITIGQWAFTGNDSLTSITIGNDVTTIDDFAFHRTISLVDVTIESSVEVIGHNAFSNCENLEEIHLNEGLKTIEDNAFYMCPKIETIFIPSSVTFIGFKAFNYCTNMTSILVSPQNPYYTSIDGVLYSNNLQTLIYYPSSKTNSSFTVPSHVRIIKANAFEACYTIRYLYISSGVTTIEQEAFIYNAILKVYIPDTVHTIGFEAFYGQTGVTIYCEAEAKPSGWNERWYMNGQTILWGIEQ